MAEKNCVVEPVHSVHKVSALCFWQSFSIFLCWELWHRNSQKCYFRLKSFRSAIERAKNEVTLSPQFIAFRLVWFNSVWSGRVWLLVFSLYLSSHVSNRWVHSHSGQLARFISLPILRTKCELESTTSRSTIHHQISRMNATLLLHKRLSKLYNMVNVINVYYMRWHI